MGIREVVVRSTISLFLSLSLSLSLPREGGTSLPRLGWEEGHSSLKNAHLDADSMLPGLCLFYFGERRGGYYCGCG